MQFHPFARRFLALVLTAAFMTAAALSGFAVYAMPIQAAYPQESIYLFDADTGEALVEQNPDLPRCVASLTKMMTALLVLESGTDLNASITIPASLTPELQSIRANRGHTIGLQAGESVRRLDQLAPYGADNPSPVFVLEMAVVEGVYAVSEGKHCRLRLRQGNASVYAVWFGMPPEQLPYAMGDVVDAALNLSVYDSPRGAQLSGRIIELHPAGLGNTAAEQAALVQALRRGTPLTPEQKESIAPERSHIITVYRELQARRWPKICSPCLQNSARRTPAGRWWPSPRWNRSASSQRLTGAGQSSGNSCLPPARRTLPMRPS